MKSKIKHKTHFRQFELETRKRENNLNTGKKILIINETKTKPLRTYFTSGG